MTYGTNNSHAISIRDIPTSVQPESILMVDPSNYSPYHTGVATKRTAKKQNNAPLGCLAGIFILILLSGLLLFNKAKIEETLKNTQFFEQFKPKESTQDKKPEPKVEPIAQSQDSKPKEVPSSPVTLPQTTPAKATESEKSPKPSATPENAPQTTPKEQPKQRAPATVPKEKQDQTKDRSLYFMQLTEDGSLIRTKVNRSIKVSDSPLFDVLQSLLAGPTETEKKRGLISVIPPGSRLLSATVKNGIAYLNFNDAFQFNSYGVEGYTAQLKQVVWTATEFSTVQGVQILIEGKSLMYLGGEGIRVDRPLTRESF
uniref:GerMN domain-containing protein n=1 Tax=Gracilinema caldarium TaxID=215591 RepID=A0A7C3IS03_9SPIR